MDVFASIVAVLAGANAALLGVVVLRRLRLSARERARAAIEARLKPGVLGFVAGGEDLPAATGERDDAVLAELLGAFARVTQGPVRARIAEHFEAAGAVARELHVLEAPRHPHRAAAAAHRLGDMCSLEAAPVLVAALCHRDRDVRAAATRSLGRLGVADAVEPLLAALAERRVPDGLGRWALLQLGEPALPRLRVLMATGEPVQRAGAVQLLGLMGGASDAEAVEARLRDSSADVRREAALALGRIGGPRNFDALRRALDDRIPGVREAAAGALGRLRDADAAERLLALAREDRFEVARAASRALAQIDPDRVHRAASSGAHLREASDLAGAR